MHWLNLIRFTIMDGDYLFNMRHSESVVVLTPQQQVNNNSFLVPASDDVLPPSGVGLERVVNLLYWFCPEAKQLMSDSGRDAGSQLDDPQHSMIQLSSQGILEISIILEKLRLKCYGLPPLCHPLPLYALYFCETSSILHFLDPLPFLSSPKILLGILMGLEAVWASPVAPRISIQQAINTLIQVDDISYVEQSFPVCGANKASVDYAYRRVDTNSAVFKFTCKILLAIMEVCYAQDCLEKQQLQEKGGEKDVEGERKNTKLSDAMVTSSTTVFSLPPAPLDRLMHCLTPRELAILLSDIRRNLRLRLGFYYIKQRKALSDIYPEIINNNNSNDQPPLMFMLNPLPRTPAFITPGLIVALIQAHLIEDGIASCLGPLIHSMEVLTQHTSNQHKHCSSHMGIGGSLRATSADGCSGSSTADGNSLLDPDLMEVVEVDDENGDTIVEEISVNGEQFVIIK
ncbi:unnamed protein product [Trichobilharzia regenti]|nr:unnamed protein product [Trichobilharzia regenti]